MEGALGWLYEFEIRPSSDQALVDKYNIGDFVQVRWAQDNTHQSNLSMITSIMVFRNNLSSTVHLAVHCTQAAASITVLR